MSRRLRRWEDGPTAAGRLPPRPSPAPPRVAVAADQVLVSQAVRAAIRHRGYDAVVVRWPAGPEAEEPHGRTRARRSSRRDAGRPPDVAVLLSDLGRVDAVRAAQSLVGGLEVPWLVLTRVPYGPAWGAMYERGAALVAPTDLGLHDLYGLIDELLDDLHDGLRGPGTGPDGARRRELVVAWRAYARRHGELSARLGTLTSREEEVLEQLHRGLGVRSIAAQGDVAEATVRSQVKAILRKLGVNSQIAAVAAYQETRGSLADLPAFTEPVPEPVAKPVPEPVSRSGGS